MIRNLEQNQTPQVVGGYSYAQKLDVTWWNHTRGGDLDRSAA